MKRTYTTLPYTEYPVADGNFDTSRVTIDRIILHSTNSSYNSAVSWFGNPKAGTSAHYIISNNGDLAAMLEEYNTAYHSGNYAMNQRSIGIEHEGYSGMVRTDKEYATSAKLVADICKFYGILCNRSCILPHKEVVATACPTDLDIDRIIREANAILNGTPVQPPSNQNVVDEFEKIKVLLGMPKDVSPHQVYENIDGKIQQIKQLQGVIEESTKKYIADIAAMQKELDLKTELANKLNQNINDRNSDIAKLNAELSTVKQTLLETTAQRDNALEQAKKVPELFEQVQYLEGLKTSWTSKEENFNKIIVDLKKQLDFVKSPIKKMLLVIYNEIKK